MNQQNTYRKRMLAEGRCTKCGKPADGAYCDEHRKYHRDLYANMTEEEREKYKSTIRDWREANPTKVFIYELKTKIDRRKARLKVLKKQIETMSTQLDRLNAKEERRLLDKSIEDAENENEF